MTACCHVSVLCKLVIMQLQASEIVTYKLLNPVRFTHSTNVDASSLVFDTDGGWVTSYFIIIREQSSICGI